MDLGAVIGTARRYAGYCLKPGEKLPLRVERANGHHSRNDAVELVILPLYVLVLACLPGSPLPHIQAVRLSMRRRFSRSRQLQARPMECPQYKPCRLKS
jgi:hypothetical protein